MPWVPAWADIGQHLYRTLISESEVRGPRRRARARQNAPGRVRASAPLRPPLTRPREARPSRRRSPLTRGGRPRARKAGSISVHSYAVY
eukprot:scaffold4990_cov387-Prasinococcus_capsulatus_cf.AAC.3